MRANGTRPLNDVIIQEQDLRGALSVSDGRDTASLRIVRDRMVGRFADLITDLPLLDLLGDRWRWMSAGEPAEPQWRCAHRTSTSPGRW